MKKIYKYKGFWGANNGTRPVEALESNNKNKLKKLVKDICEENVFEGNSGTWSVEDAATGEEIFNGHIQA